MQFIENYSEWLFEKDKMYGLNYGNLFSNTLQVGSPQFVADTRNTIIDKSSQALLTNSRGKPVAKMSGHRYFICHETDSIGTVDRLIQGLNRKWMGIQWIVDRDGTIYKTFPDGLQADHAGVESKHDKPTRPRDQDNNNTVGVEVNAEPMPEGAAFANVMPVQAESVRRLIRYLGFTKEQIFAHGEITRNKREMEGVVVKTWVLNHWDMPFLSMTKTKELLGKERSPLTLTEAGGVSPIPILRTGLLEYLKITMPEKYNLPIKGVPDIKPLPLGRDRLGGSPGSMGGL